MLLHIALHDVAIEVKMPAEKLSPDQERMKAVMTNPLNDGDGSRYLASTICAGFSDQEAFELRELHRIGAVSNCLRFKRNLDLV